MSSIRTLLVDDHRLFRKGLANLFQNTKDFHVVGQAEDGKEAVNKALKLKPDLILMDIHMPEMNGVDAARHIREALPTARIVMLTALEEDRNLFEAIKVGAQGYLLKNVEPEAFFETLRGVFRGEAAISRVTAAKILNEFRIESRETNAGSLQDELSEREMDVLQLIAQGMTNKEIGHTLRLAENTVKNHLKSILSKLHLQNRVQAATFALKNGLLAPDHDT